MSDLIDTFTDDLNAFSTSLYEKFLKAIKDGGVEEGVTGVDLRLKPDSDFIAKYGLNDDIQFVLNVRGNKGKMLYYYQGHSIEPVCHYIQPEDSKTVHILTVLQEAIAQATNKPDIRALESDTDLAE